MGWRWRLLPGKFKLATLRRILPEDLCEQENWEIAWKSQKIHSASWSTGIHRDSHSGLLRMSIIFHTLSQGSITKCRSQEWSKETNSPVFPGKPGKPCLVPIILELAASRISEGLLWHDKICHLPTSFEMKSCHLLKEKWSLLDYPNFNQTVRSWRSQQNRMISSEFS